MILACYTLVEAITVKIQIKQHSSWMLKAETVETFILINKSAYFCCQTNAN